MSKPTIPKGLPLDKRRNAVVDIRKQAIEERLNAKRKRVLPQMVCLNAPPAIDSSLGAHVDLQHAPTVAFTSLFVSWQQDPLNIDRLGTIATEFKNRSNPPIEELASLLAASGMEWIVQSMKDTTDLHYIEVLVELLSRISHVENERFTRTCMDSLLTPFLLDLLTGQHPPPPETVYHIIWLCANQAVESIVMRDYFLISGLIPVLETYLSVNPESFNDCLATAAWLFERLTSGLPLPNFVHVGPLLPALQPMLDFSRLNDDMAMQFDLLNLLTNLLNYDIPLLQSHFNRQLLDTIMLCADEADDLALSEACMTFFVTLSNKSDVYCEILLSMEFIDFLEMRLPVSSNKERLQILKAVTNILFGTRNLEAVILTRNLLCGSIRTDLDNPSYLISLEAFFVLANALYFCKTMEQVFFVAGLDTQMELLCHINGRDVELSDMIIRALHEVMTVMHAELGKPGLERDKLVDFANEWLVSADLDEMLNTYVSGFVTAEAAQNANKLLDRIEGLKRLLESQEDSIVKSLREMIHYKTCETSGFSF
jgi:hypothetical protein